MAPTKLIAGLIGPLMAAIGIAMLLNRQAFPEMISQVRAKLRDHIPVRSFKPACRRRHRSRSQRLDRRLAGDHHDIGLALDRRRPRPHVVSTKGFGRSPQPLADNPTLLLVSGVVLLALGAFLSFKAYGTTI